MKKLFALILPFAFVIQPAFARPLSAQGLVSPSVPAWGFNFPRIGLNLGSPTSYDATMLQNLLQPEAPGFEPIHEGRTLEVATSPAATSGSFADDVNYFNQATNFYNGAILTLAYTSNPNCHMGATAKVTGYAITNGLPVFSYAAGTLCSGTNALKAGDWVVFDAFADPMPAAGNVYNWDTDGKAWKMTTADFHSGAGSLEEDNDGRTHTIFAQSTDSLNWTCTPSYICKNMNMEPVKGAWELTYWVKNSGVKTKPNVNASFNRLRNSGGNASFVNDNYAVPNDSTWHQRVVTFTGSETGKESVGTLIFELTVSSGASGGAIRFDDIFLGPTIGVSGFRSQTLTEVQRLHPGYIRGYYGQMAEDEATATNTNETARSQTSFRGPVTGVTDGFGGGTQGYSLPDFLGFVDAVGGTSPYIIIPTVSSYAELAAYGRYLCSAQTTYAFPEILIEFGNEQWNGVFRGAGIDYPAPYAAAVSADFTQVVNAYTGAGCANQLNSTGPLKLVGAWQYASSFNTNVVQAGLPNTSNVYVAVAPYYYYNQNVNDTPANMWNDSFALTSTYLTQEMRGLLSNQQMATYEGGINNNAGTETSSIKRYAQSGSYAGGGSDGNLWLNFMDTGVRFQMPFTFDQLFQSQSIKGVSVTEPIWGMAHDLNDAYGLMRPSALSLQLANQIIPPNGMADLHLVTGLPATVQCVAFATAANDWNALCANDSATATTVQLTFPNGTLPSSMMSLHYTVGYTDLNETSPAQVTIIAGTVNNLGNNTVSFAMQPWGFAGIL